MVYKIGIIGDKDSVVGFMTVGFKVVTVENEKEAYDALKKMAKEEYAIIYITEEYAIQLESEIDKYKSQPIPAIICLPSRNGSSGYGMQSIKKSVENAVGADILFNK